MKKHATPASAKSPEKSDPQDWQRPPLKPHKKLLIFFGAIYLIWVIALLAMYFTTVYPRRHRQSTTTQSAVSAGRGFASV